LERVTFLVENNERLSCLLNPETVIMRRTTGVRPRESLNGLISTDRSGDKPLLFTGAGTTTIDLDLVFDVSIPGSSIVSQNVRDLTQPIWNLAENHQRSDRTYRPAVCRFIWGKSWNIPGVIAAIAEKLESFSSQGIPRRSWLRLRLIRMQDQPTSSLLESEMWPTAEQQTPSSLIEGTSLPETLNVQKENSFPDMLNQPELPENVYERIDLSAFHLTGDPHQWRDIANRYSLTDPLEWLKSSTSEPNSANETQDTGQ
jgi:Contractile injection system tube protein